MGGIGANRADRHRVEEKGGQPANIYLANMLFANTACANHVGYFTNALQVHSN